MTLRSQTIVVSGAYFIPKTAFPGEAKLERKLFKMSESGAVEIEAWFIGKCVRV